MKKEGVVKNTIGKILSKKLYVEYEVLGWEAFSKNKNKSILIKTNKSIIKKVLQIMVVFKVSTK